MLDAVERDIVHPKPFHDPGVVPAGDSALDAVEQSVFDPSPAPAWQGPLAEAPIGHPPTGHAGSPPAPVPPLEASTHMMDVLESRIEADSPDAFGFGSDRMSTLLDALERNIESNVGDFDAAGPAIESLQELGAVAEEVGRFQALISPDLMLDLVQSRVMQLVEKRIENRPGSTDGDKLRKELNAMFAQMRACLDHEAETTSVRLRFQGQLIQTFSLLINDVLWQIRKDLAAESSGHVTGLTPEHPAFVWERSVSPKAKDAPEARRAKGWPANPHIDVRRTGSPPRRTFHMPKVSHTRSRRARPSGQQRYCYDAQDIVPLSQCDSCDKFRNWSEGSQAELRQCLHDWSEVQRTEEFRQDADLNDETRE